MIKPCGKFPCRSEWCKNNHKCFIYENYKPVQHKEPYSWANGKYTRLKKRENKKIGSIHPCEKMPCEFEWCIENNRCHFYDNYIFQHHKAAYEWKDGEYFPSTNSSLPKFAPAYDTSSFFSNKSKRPKNVDYPKYEFYSRENECFYCGIEISDKNQTRDHIFPRTKGGILCAGNKVWSCKKCNSYKGNFTIPEYCEKLKKWIGMKKYESKKELFEKILEKVEFMKSKLYSNGN